MAKASCSITKLITDSENNLFCISNKNIVNNPVLYKYENLEWVQKGTFLGDYTNFYYDQYSMDIDAKIDSTDNIIVAYLKPVYDEFYIEFFGYDLYVSRYSPITHLWTQLGATKINDTTLIHIEGMMPLAQISMEIINDDIYVAYTKIVMGENGPQEAPQEATITVKKYIPLTDEWVDTGSTAKMGELMSAIPYLKKDNNNILHLLYMSVADGEIQNARASIKQYSGGIWIPYLTDISAEHTMGMVWSSAGKARHCLHFDGTNTPHVLYTSVVYPEGGGTPNHGETIAFTIYATHNGIAWAETSFEENSGSCCILEDNDGVLYCAYNVSDPLNKTSHIQIMKKIDGTWVLHEGNLENVSFSVSPADIIFKSNNELIISYSDANANERPTVSSYGVRPFTPFRATFGTTPDLSPVILPLVSGYDYDFTIDWGDGTANTIKSFDDPNKEHLYAEAGTYQVMIRGKMPIWKYYDPVGGTNGTPQHLISIDDWGNVGYGLKVQNFEYMFYDCVNLESIPELNVAGQWVGEIFENCVNLTDAILKNISSSVSYMTTGIAIDDPQFETIFDNLYPNYNSFQQPTIGLPSGVTPQTLTDKATAKGWIIQKPK